MKGSSIDHVLTHTSINFLLFRLFMCQAMITFLTHKIEPCSLTW
jgi:hypothetical protein